MYSYSFTSRPIILSFVNSIYNKIWQAFVVLLPVKTVGVMGDNRTFEYLLLLRAITSEDGMTADYYEFKKSFMQNISNKIVNSIRGMFRGVGIKLVDFKVEFGFTNESGKTEIVLADEISPDTCRLWDSVTDKKLDKDRFRKDLGDLIPAYTEVAKRLGILHEQSNVSAVNVTKLSSVKNKRK